MNFPKNFLWGAATAGHQVDGDADDNWSRWERENAERLAGEAKKQFGWMKHWDVLQPEAETPENYLSGKACAHWDRYREDIDLVKHIGLNSYRFSLEWARIEPEKGHVDVQALQHYEDMLVYLRDNDIEPCVTLWHWTFPRWLADEGGWLAEDCNAYFEKYVNTIVTRLGNYCTYWITINEPEIYTHHSYYKGYWPPQEKSLIKTFQVINKLLHAHKSAYTIIKTSNPHAQVSIAKNNLAFHPVSGLLKPLNTVHTRIKTWLWNYVILDNLIGHLDYIGVNYYFIQRIGWGSKPDELPQSDLGWEIYPEGMYEVCSALWERYSLPIIITENGLADKKDVLRKIFLQSTFIQLEKLIEHGIDLRGYMYWSLLDNFEWDKGFWPRFGLVEVEYHNDLKRKVRESADIFKNVI